jgi:hypothetical protein
MTDENTDIITVEEFNKVLEHANNRKSPRLGNLPMNYLNLEETN